MNLFYWLNAIYSLSKKKKKKEKEKKEEGEDGYRITEKSVGKEK